MRYDTSGPAASCAAFALAVVALSPAAHAQTVTPAPVVTERPMAGEDHSDGDDYANGASTSCARASAGTSRR